MVWHQCPWAYPMALAAGVNVFMGTGCGGAEEQISRSAAARSRSPRWSRGRTARASSASTSVDEADARAPDDVEDLPVLPPSKASRRATFLTLTNHFYSGSSPLPQGRGMYPGMIARAEMVGFNLYPLQIWCRRVTLHAVFDAQRELVALARGKPTYQWIEAGPMYVCAGPRSRAPRSSAPRRGSRSRAVLEGSAGSPDVWAAPIRAEIRRLSHEIAALSPALLGEDGETSWSLPSDTLVRAGVRRRTARRT